jgi:predicted P-loop ATPase
LQKYYAESKLDSGKDDQLLMCESWLILDDEMGGKSKKDEKMFKDLTSKKEFSLRAAYAKSNQKYKRLAVLCGTSNDTQLINDPTGNTRMLPVNVKSIDHNIYNSIDKIALLIEVVRCYDAGDKWELTRDELERLEDTSESFRPAPFEREIIQQFFQKGTELWTFTEIKIKVENETGQKIFNNKLFMVELKRLFGEPQRRKRNGTVDRVYTVAPAQAIFRENAVHPQSIDNEQVMF